MANTTSQSYSFDQDFSIDEIIADAYERLGLVGTAGHQLKTARRSLNILFQEWGNRGIHFWEVGNTNINLVAGATTNVDATDEGSGVYTFYRNSVDSAAAAAASPQATTVPTTNVFGISDILNVSYRQNYNTTNQSDTGLTKVARDAYAATANKASNGTPSQFWVQRFVDKVTLTIYPLPNSTAASNFLNVYYVRRIQDVGAYTNASDTPFRFVPCMISGLSYYLSMKFAPQRTQEMKLLYEDELARALSEDGSPASTYITPENILSKYIMARFAKGSRALAISDRSGAAFPYREMVKEWTGAWVHNSEFEAKQPQLEPHPVGADPQGLMHARPARVEFPVQDILPENPFTTTAASKVLSISFPDNKLNEGTTHVRFQAVKQPIGGVAVTTLELSTTLNGNISDTATSIVLTDGSEFPTAGYIVIEKVNSETGKYENETIEYTGRSTNTLTGCTRGTSAPYKGKTFANTTAGSHLSGAKVFGSYLATAVGTTFDTGAQPSTKIIYNSLTVPLVSNATSAETAGGFQCTIGPVNDRA